MTIAGYTRRIMTDMRFCLQTAPFSRGWVVKIGKALTSPQLRRPRRIRFRSVTQDKTDHDFRTGYFGRCF
jgi:hypothetical protein